MKRGISPLIATVLIIGFTIGVAMLIFTWSGTFTEELTEDTSEEAIQQLRILSDVSFDIEEVSFSNGNIQLKLKNKKSTIIDEFSVRIVSGSGETEVIDISEGLEGYAIKTLSFPYPDFESINSVEIIPKVNIDNELIIASNVKEEYDVTDEFLVEGIKNGAILYVPFESDPPVDLKGHILTNNGVTFNPAGGYDGGGFYDLSGTDYIEVNSLAVDMRNENSFSVSFWAKSGGSGFAFSMTGGISSTPLFGVYPYDSAGGLGVRVWYGGGNVDENGATRDPNQWHNFIYVQSSVTSHEMFVDGVSVGTSSVSRTLSASLDRAAIGTWLRSDDTTTQFFSGDVDDILVFDRALSTEEIQLLYNK